MMPYQSDGLASISLTLAAIVILLWLGVWVMRRMRPGAGMWNSRDCAVVRSLALGPRERLLVVQVGERQLVIGVGGSAVSLLCELDTPLVAGPGGAGDNRFGEAVRQAVGRWPRG